MTVNYKQNRGKKNYSIIAFILLFLAGSAILFYPKISYWVAEQNHTVAVQDYNRVVGNLTNDEKKEMWAAAVNYNERLVTSIVMDPFADTDHIDPFDEYYQTLDIGNGMMGSIHIPKIDILIPIYHGVSDEVLDKGIGHIKATALPVGGLGTHGVLTGHSGLSHAEMFNDLEQLNLGDEFFLNILDETLAYRINEINVVLPDDISNLQREKDKDKITLITCTPTGINSHRLLVTGERIELDKVETELPLETKSIFPWWIVALVIGLLIALLIIGRIVTKSREKKNRKADTANAYIDEI